MEPADDYRLIVSFDNGEMRIYDANPLIKGDWFGKLRDPDTFKTVHVAGLSVEWADGQDVCRDELYHASEPMPSLSEQQA